MAEEIISDIKLYHWSPRRKREKGWKKIFGEIMAGVFPNLRKAINS